jgi:hypothetical protein
MRPINRPTPQLPAQAMKTYQLVAPITTHYRSATCSEVACPAHQQGWSTLVDETTPLGRRQAAYIRIQAGRQFTEERTPEGTTFAFPAGQRCFRPHQVSLEREPLYIVRDGDWRGNPRGTKPRQHTRAENWVEDFATHQQTLADRLGQG